MRNVFGRGWFASLGVLSILGGMTAACSAAPEPQKQVRKATVADEAREDSESDDDALVPETESPPESPAPPTNAAPPAAPPKTPQAPPAQPPPAQNAVPATRDTLVGAEKLQPGEQLTSANGKAKAMYQADGNFVVYGPGGALWATATHGKPVGQVVMQDDGNLVLYSSAGTPLWSSKTQNNPGAKVIMQDDCNLVVYSAAGPALWASHTSCN